ncbi:MAG TPA: flagellar basal body P-ring protein FlgI [Candidatus Angelobacter sp.]|nr:flagellar basal body P-ring protein FlgI [Candidatus Angelobacter sp.]
MKGIFLAVLVSFILLFPAVSLGQVSPSQPLPEHTLSRQIIPGQTGSGQTRPGQIAGQANGPAGLEPEGQEIQQGQDTQDAHKALIRDITSVEGIRDNLLLGYGMVVGLKGTGDRQQTIFTTQTLGNILQRMGVQVPANTIRVANVASVFVTAVLPPFASPGTHLDVTVSSMGDAKSLEGGLLLLTPLYGAGGKIYAEAQGAVTLGGYAAGGGGNSKQVNHPTVARISGGGLVERDTSVDLGQMRKVSLVLQEANFNTAEDVAKAINASFARRVAVAVDARRIEMDVSASGAADVPSLLARVESLPVEVHRRARVVVNERTGTVVMGRDVRLGAVSILHGSFSVEVATQFAVSQPNALASGQTTTVPETTVSAAEAPARQVELNEGASVEQLVSGLQKIGATARDVIAILQAVKAAGALDADLEVI